MNRIKVIIETKSKPSDKAMAKFAGKVNGKAHDVFEETRTAIVRSEVDGLLMSDEDLINAFESAHEDDKSEPEAKPETIRKAALDRIYGLICGDDKFGVVELGRLLEVYKTFHAHEVDAKHEENERRKKACRDANVQHLVQRALARQ